MLAKLSLLIAGALAATEVAMPEPESEHAMDEIDFEESDDFVANEDSDDSQDSLGSLDSLLESLQGPNGENAEKIAELKALLSSGDESEDSMAKLQELFDQILGGHGGSFGTEDEDEDFDL